MFKAILLFIKTHAIATTITTVVVVGGVTTAVVVPPIVEEYKLTKSVEANLNKLVSSNYQVSNEETNEVINEVSEENNKEVEDSKPLTFRIERVEEKSENGEGVGFVIVPSYDKDFSQWSKADKEAYNEALQESARLTKEEVEKMEAQEEQNLANTMAQLEVEGAWKSYDVGFGTDISYNSLKNTYKGRYYILHPEDVSKEYSKEFDEISAEEFRTTIYPEILASLKRGRDWASPEADEIISTGENSDYNSYIAILNKLYHLSD